VVHLWATAGQLHVIMSHLHLKKKSQTNLALAKNKMQVKTGKLFV